MLSLQEFVQNRYNKTIAECSNEELYLALLNYSKLASSKKPVNTGKKKVYYISAEFLIGKLLSNNLINLGLYDDVKKELAAAGKDLIEVEEVEYDIDPKDLRVDIYHASGAGGQNVNKVATAVRIVHLPTNIKVEMQEERTQQKNREKAMKIIRARVADHFAQIAQDEQDAERKSTIGTGDRSERIRTYNFPQNRVTDHRIGLTLQKLDTILSGKLDEVVDALVLYDQTQKLEELNK